MNSKKQHLSCLHPHCFVKPDDIELKKMLFGFHRKRNVAIMQKKFCISATINETRRIKKSSTSLDGHL